MLYPRPQLRLLLAVAALLLLGLAVREWRAGFPEWAERLESFDREEPVTPLPPPPPPPAREARPRRGAGSSRPADEPGQPSDPVTADPRPLDVNQADAEQIARLPGIGPGLARRIVEERQRRGRFDSPEALRQVLGLGAKRLAALRDLISVGD
ncbi:MAG: helix-hairpin-helix domain-containing protein [Candidatus Rokubacteria bacterium]|nr:helix-hairpin-helix domain-containing protein [Candidatus Rokubacteria bacterium]